MHLNPFTNALLAAGYIWGVVSLIALISPPPNTPDTWLTPIVVLSLLVFSVAFMGFTFFYRPVVLLFENKKDEALGYFVRTLGYFGALALAAILIATQLFNASL